MTGTRIDILLLLLCNHVETFCYRLAQPDDVAGIVAFLCSDDASYITGETVIVSGGMQSRL